MAGWVKLHRDIINKSIYQQPPLYLRVFERLIVEANSRCKRIPYNRDTKLIRRGEKLTSLSQIAEWVGWYERGIFRVPNKKTISDILGWLIENELIEIHNKGNARETHYNIVKYCIYQSMESDQSNAQVTPKYRRPDTNKNVKNVKNVNKDLKPSLSEKYSDESIEILLSKYLFELMKKNNPKVKEPNFQSWAKNMDYILRIDRRSEDDVRKLIELSQRDNFWKANILSTAKLREKFDQLYIKLNSTSKSYDGKPGCKDYEQREYSDEHYKSLYVTFEPKEDKDE